jgi:hypothetical protein
MKKIILILAILFQISHIARAQLNLHDGLYAYFPFNGNVKDQSANHIYDLIASGGRYSTDRFGNISAYEFNGTTDYLVNNTIFNFPIYCPINSSVSFWVNMHEFPLNNPNQECVFLGLGGVEGSGFGILCKKDSIVVVDATNYNRTNSSYKLQLDNWYHVVVRTSRGIYQFPSKYIHINIQLYINDTLRSTGDRMVFLSCGDSYNPYIYSGYLQLGSMKYSDSTDRTSFFNGKIDDVMFYNRTLSTQEIHDLFMDNTSSNLHPSICMVSVNESDRNFVTWQKYQNSSIDSTYIYRESSLQTDQYDLIGKVPYSMPGIFIDSTSNAGIRSNKYKISFKYYSDYESEKSKEHKTMHLMLSKGVDHDWQLMWEPYLGIPVQSYKIYRGTSKSDLSLIDSTSTSNLNYTDVYAPSDTNYYELKIDLPQDCSNLKYEHFTSSCSNIVSNYDFTESLSNNVLDNIIFYPNPADNVIYIRRCNATKAIISIFSLDGKLLLSKHLTNDGNSMDISALSPGVYLVKLVDSGVSLRKKLIKK